MAASYVTNQQLDVFGSAILEAHNNVNMALFKKAMRDPEAGYALEQLLKLHVDTLATTIIAGIRPTHAVEITEQVIGELRALVSKVASEKIASSAPPPS